MEGPARRVAAQATGSSVRNDCHRAPATRDVARANAASIHFAEGRLAGALVEDPPGSAMVWAIHCNSSLRSAAVCQRASASLARHLRTTRSSEAGVTGCSVESGGDSSLRIAAIRPAWLSARNGALPAMISYSTRPNEKMSLRPSTGLPSNCSGDMYWSVPRMLFFVVRDSATGPVATLIVDCAATLARPKSSSFRPDLVMRMLPGLKSRWTTPLTCAACSASAA